MSESRAPSSYQEAIEYLGGLVNYERLPPDAQARKEILNLDRIEWLLARVGRPHLKIPCVHVAGT